MDVEVLQPRPRIAAVEEEIHDDGSREGKEWGCSFSTYY
jgi:hypothetical protein